MGSKTVIVHIGPHKTGSTSIQHELANNKAALGAADTLFLSNKFTHDAAMMLSRGFFDEAEDKLKEISSYISASKEKTIILSHEDFCGDLPGRTRNKRIYPRLAKNLRVLRRSLLPHRVKFVYFQRAHSEWLRSCYNQHLKYRTFFFRFCDFEAHFEDSENLDKKLARCTETFKDSFLVIPYSRNRSAGIGSILEISGVREIRLKQACEDKNTSPNLESIRLLERTNKVSEFKATAWFSKRLILAGWKPSKQEINRYAKSAWSPPEQAQISFPNLLRRVEKRVNKQNVEDILPETDVDLRKLAFEFLPQDASLPDVPRTQMRDQSKILDYHLRGKSRLAKLNALTISYLRRDTNLTEKARFLFNRIWFEEGATLVNELSTRWLISTLQTFLEHGENEAQRIIGASGYFYANMIKIYEGERAIEGKEQDLVHANVTPSTKNKFQGMDRYSVGGTDLLLNTNALALDLSMRDDVAGLVLQEFLLRVQHSKNVFTRMDDTRLKHSIEVPNFADTWSFFERPSNS